MSESQPASERLAVYGSLGPGRANHHELAGIAGSWTRGRVRGSLREAGWGAALGFPGIVLAETGDDWVEVDLLESAGLAEHWPRLDDFEGSGYRRVACRVHTASGELDAQIYELVAD